MQKTELDVAVALIFFARPETLKQVFVKVKEARPSKMFLIQDGPRKNNENDREGIAKCREIVSDIDWTCQVYTNYSDVNMGCGERPYTGISWVFEHVDRAIILEDDCVPAETFFPFCLEMLERFKHDTRIGAITGLNRFVDYNFGGYSYGFVRHCAIGGWATWKSRWEKYDFKMKNIENAYLLQCLKLDIIPSFAAKAEISLWIKRKKEIDGKCMISYWDYQWCFVMHQNSWLSIVPKYSQISNIGVGVGSAHLSGAIKSLPKKIAAFFFMSLKNLELPLVHPEFVVPNRIYDADYYKIIYPNFFKRAVGSLTYRTKKMWRYILNLLGLKRKRN